MQKGQCVSIERSPSYVTYECKMCGECCRGEGGIYIDRAELEAIAGFLGETPEECFSRHCETRNRKMYVRAGENGYCVFANAGLCGIHPVKPDPCRRWPFFRNIVNSRENFLVAKNNCQGFLPDGTYEDFLEDARAFEELERERKNER